jgi:hypothetical protein
VIPAAETGEAVEIGEAEAEAIGAVETVEGAAETGDFALGTTPGAAGRKAA